MKYASILLIAILCFSIGCSENASTAQDGKSGDVLTVGDRVVSPPVNPSLPQIVVKTVPYNGGTKSEWLRFRGPNGSGMSSAKRLPLKWSETTNVTWRTKIPGPGGSSPVVVGNRIFLTYYTGYGLAPNQGDMKNLRRHVICVNRNNGKIVWDKEFVPKLPESNYTGNGAKHGYASSTPTTDGEKLYVFFGKSGVYCFDLDGNQIWHASVGSNLSGYGSANSPLLYKNLVIINATIESNSVVALDKKTGDEIWRAPNVRNAYNTPVLVDALGGKKELVLNESTKVIAFDPETGKELWRVGGFRFYVCPSVIAHKGIVYATRAQTLAIRAGGRGDVTDSHVLWKVRGGSSVPSPLYHDGRLHWVSEGGNAHCVDAASGKKIYDARLTPQPLLTYSSVIFADGRIYSVARNGATYVLAADAQFKQLAYNVFADDRSRTNASPIADGNQILLRTDRYLYCIELAGKE